MEEKGWSGKGKGWEGKGKGWEGMAAARHGWERLGRASVDRNGNEGDNEGGWGRKEGG